MPAVAPVAAVAPSRSLREVFAEVPDHRSPSGRRHDLPSILTLVVVGMLAGMRSMSACVQFAAERPGLAEALGFNKRARRSKRELGIPCGTTFHYVFKDLDVVRFEDALRRWIIEQGRDDVLRRVVAIDGKTLRGSAGNQLPGVHLLAAYSTDLGAVLAQLRVDASTNEHKAALQLLKLLPLEGTLVTGDAAFTQKDICTTIIEGGGDYFLTVKGNQPALRQDIAQLFEGEFSPSRVASA
jgi:hypothetical protein